MKRTSGTRTVLLGLSLFICDQSAQAHIVAGEATGFLSGVLHPVSGLDHVLAMVSVGVWGAQLGEPAIWILPVTFPMMMAFGGLLAASTGRYLVPVAHDAGLYWARRGLLKRPGTIRIVIGPPIPSAGRDAREITEQAKAWIDAKVAELGA